MGHPLITEYSLSLSILNGDDFQDEVSARLQGVIINFQPVPSNPQGDAGIDGFSHHAERAYCCYGPEQDAFKKNKDEGGTGKAEAAKLQGAGISPKQCPRK